MAIDLSGVDYKKLTQAKTINKFSDMPAEVMNEAIEIVTSSIEKFTKAEVLEMDNATRYIKEQMDKSFGPSWHCCIGEGYTFDITSQRQNLLYMYYSGVYAILLWKC
jgi:dynein light chain 4, axonemal